MMALTQVGHRLLAIDELSGPVLALKLRTVFQAVTDSSKPIDDLSLDDVKDWTLCAGKLDGPFAQGLNALTDAEFHSFSNIWLAQIKDAANYNTTVGTLTDEQVLSSLMQVGKKVA